jgi:hypothetical protein
MSDTISHTTQGKQSHSYQYSKINDTVQRKFGNKFHSANQNNIVGKVMLPCT